VRRWRTCSRPQPDALSRRRNRLNRIAVNDQILYGQGERFRRAGLLERLASRFRNRTVARRLHHAIDIVMWLATAGRGLKAVLPEGEVVRLIPSCRHMRWNVEEYRAFRAATRDGATVLDIGANAGSYTILFAQWVGPTGRVIAFEPVPAICELLRVEVELNGVADRVEIVNAAVAGSEGTVAMTAPGAIGINRVVPSSEPGLLQVCAVTIDGFCATHRVRPDVIKIDVEGLELDVLRGARRTLATNRLASVFTEWHPSIWPSLSISSADVAGELARQGLHAQALRAGDEVWNVEGICARLVRA
jgi:FkbM family methyltransferase